MAPDSSSTLFSQRDVLAGLRSVVSENLALLTPVQQAWQPTDYLPDLQKEGWEERLTAFRSPALELSDELLVVLVAGMVTEEALPSYAIALNLIAEDGSGTSDCPWALWMRGWTAEENRHGDLLNAFLRLTGRVDMRSVEVTTHHLIKNGFNPRAHPDLYAGLIYTAFQERATKVSHNNVGRLAGDQGNSVLKGICARIAGDEARHETFYTRVMAAVFDQDPAAAVVTCGDMLRRVISMPGRLMFDGKDPDLFDHFAVVAQRLGAYTARDYAAIVRHLVQTWGVAGLSVSGKAARAQEFLCRHADQVESKAEALAGRIAAEPQVAFSWIEDRLA